MESNNQIVIHHTQDNNLSVEVTLKGETVWLSQKQMAELFEKDQSVIARHINNVFHEGELTEESNMQILHILFQNTSPQRYIRWMSSFR